MGKAAAIAATEKQAIPAIAGMLKGLRGLRGFRAAPRALAASRLHRMRTGSIRPAPRPRLPQPTSQPMRLPQSQPARPARPAPRPAPLPTARREVSPEIRELFHGPYNPSLVLRHGGVLREPKFKLYREPVVPHGWEAANPPRPGPSYDSLYDDLFGDYRSPR